MNAAEIATAIRADIDKFLAETMADPDIAARSQDFKDGYAQGFREATATLVAVLGRPAGVLVAKP
jgi:hypothetical protein